MFLKNYNSNNNNKTNLSALTVTVLKQWTLKLVFTHVTESVR